jgi:lysophospholipase L1-like esterase
MAKLLARWGAPILSSALLTPSCLRGGDGVVTADDPHIQYSGRVDFSDPRKPRFSWPGVSITAVFDGQKCDIRLLDGESDYNVFLDGKLHAVLRTDPSQNLYPLEKLDKGTHTLMITRRNDGNYGIGVFEGLVLEKGESLRPPPATLRRRIEVIGDSFSVGYGNEGAGVQCAELRGFENNYLAYGSIAARALGAECHTIAISGKGMVRNYGAPGPTSPNPMPDFYDRILQQDASLKWDFSRWIPDAVVINLGVNDFSTTPHPEVEAYVNAYRALIAEVRRHYPGVHVFCLAMPDFAAFVQRVVAEEERAGNRGIHSLQYGPFTEDESGCDWHPKVVAHQKIADLLVPAIREHLGWNP